MKNFLDGSDVKTRAEQKGFQDGSNHRGSSTSLLQICEFADFFFSLRTSKYGEFLLSP